MQVTLCRLSRLYLQIYLYMHMCLYNYYAIIEKSVNLKDSKEGYIEELGERKQKEEMV